MFNEHKLLRRWHDEAQSELNFARSMRDQWQAEVERLEDKAAGLKITVDPTVPKGEIHFRNQGGSHLLGKIVGIK
ncbi:hypothetical protein [Roseibium sp.]|uniref:hypothetical protein n=1 Tax=Roseibium sp. TaxID=1936156 RepID=UPI003B51E304